MMRITNIHNIKFCVGGNRQRNANKALAEQHAVGLLARLFSRYIGAGAVSAIHRAKNGILTMAGGETFLDVRWSYGPGISRLMAGDTRAAVGSQALKEWVCGINRACSAYCSHGAGGIGKILQIGIEPCCHHGNRKAEKSCYENNKQRFARHQNLESLVHSLFSLQGRTTEMLISNCAVDLIQQ